MNGGVVLITTQSFSVIMPPAICQNSKLFSSCSTLVGSPTIFFCTHHTETQTPCVSINMPIPSYQRRNETYRYYLRVSQIYNFSSLYTSIIPCATIIAVRLRLKSLSYLINYSAMGVSSDKHPL